MSLWQRAKTLMIGKARDPLDPNVFHQLSLIAFFAWVGLGADGLSSSCYGPAEALLGLKGNYYLGIFVALGTAATIFIISTCYSQIIELFPTGGGGYVVASKLLSPTFGMISGCALLIDYVLTVALSVASGAEAIFSFLPPGFAPLRIEVAIFGVVVLTVMNLRGVRETVIALMPIFLVFVITHLFAIVYACGAHADRLPEIIANTSAQVDGVTAQVGAWGLFMLLLRAYGMGAGTFTGIEAVSNGLPRLRDPKVQTGKRTMKYMAWSLSIAVFGLMIAYILYQVQPVAGKTLNAVLFENLTGDWSGGLAYTFVLITLLSEAAILFVAAQTGFVGGPLVLASMAVDRWVPTRFASLSDRLVSQNGVMLTGIAALLLIIFTKGSVHILVVLYSINVFITFVLSQAGMVRHWWQVRMSDRKWKRRMSVAVLGLLLCSIILVSITVTKFDEGGWITLAVTSALIVVVLLVRYHYNQTFKQLRRLDELMTAVDVSESSAIPNVQQHLPDGQEYDRHATTAVLLVNGYNGLGLHAIFDSLMLFKGLFKNYVFIQVGVVDAGVFKGQAEMEKLQGHIQEGLNRYVDLMRRSGYYAEGISSVGVDVVDQIDKLGPQILERFPRAIFFGGQLVFREETFLTRWLHNHIVFSVQRAFHLRGIPFIILPTRV